MRNATAPAMTTPIIVEPAAASDACGGGIGGGCGGGIGGGCIGGCIGGVTVFGVLTNVMRAKEMPSDEAIAFGMPN